MLPTGKSPLRSANKMCRRGFTFLELIFVILIIAVLTGVSMPMFKNTFLNMQMSQISSDLAEALNYARQSAILNRNEYRVRLNADGGDFWIEYKTFQDNKIKFEKLEGKFGRIYNLPKGVSMTSDKDALAFYPNGRADIATIVIKNDKTMRTFTTEGTTGYVKIK